MSKVVCVEWDDATYSSGYYDKKSPENYTPTKVKTVGHLVKRTACAVLVSMEKFYNDDGKPFDERHIVTIPKKMIKRVIDLEERKCH